MFDNNTKAQNLMNLLFEEYIRKQTEDGKPVEADKTAIIAEFLGFAKTWLQSNQPTGLVYLDEGLGLRLQNSKLICFNDSKSNTSGMQKANSHSISIYGSGGVLPVDEFKII